MNAAMSKAMYTLLIRPFNVLTVRTLWVINAERVEAHKAFRQVQGERKYILHKSGSINKQAQPGVFGVNRQGGAVLVISLIMLLLMTLIGTSGMQATSLEEKMAGNMRDRNLAFQAAESALAAGESFLGTQTNAQLDALNANPNAFNCNGLDGLFPQSGTGCAVAQPIWENINWDANAVPYVGTMANLITNPRYIIESLPCRLAPGSAAGSPCVTRAYRITARATGGTAEAVVIVQSVIEIPI